MPAIAALFLFALPLQQLDAELTEARDKFGRPEEKECNEAAAICVRKNNEAAAEVLLQVLRIGQQACASLLAHADFRDIVCGALAQLTDAYARRAVEVELKTNKDNPRLRQWCAELLGEYGDADYGESLVKALNDK